VFAYWVIHRGKFYHIRRWKAAIWSGIIFGIFGIFLFVILSFSILISADISRLSVQNISEVIKLMIGLFLTITFIIIPLIFLVTFGMHHQLKWWLNSDDYLDKIWKDPNKGRKSPIQDR